MKRMIYFVCLAALVVLTVRALNAAAQSPASGSEIQVVTGVDIPQGADSRTVRKLLRAGKKGNLAAVCPSIASFRGGQGLIKSEISKHISPSDPRASGYTLVCGSLCPSSFPASFYYSDGTLAGKFGYYGRYSGNGRPRAYCGAGGAPVCSTSAIYSRARGLRTGSSLYLKLNSRQCISFSGAPGARNGSV